MVRVFFLFFLVASFCNAAEHSFGPISFEYPSSWEIDESSTFEGFDIFSKETYSLGPNKLSNGFTVKRIPLGSLTFSEFKNYIVKIQNTNISALREKLSREKSQYSEFQSIDIDRLISIDVKDFHLDNSFHIVIDNVLTFHGYHTKWHTETVFIGYDGFSYHVSFSYPPSQAEFMQKEGKKILESIKLK